MTEHPSIRYLVLFVTGRCNLRCRYCYAGDMAGLKEMPFEVAVAAINQTALSGRSFHVQLTGGEPTLEPQLIDRIATHIETSDAQATIGVQTNGTMVDADIAKMFFRHRIDVGISMDGVAEIHDLQRGRFDATVRGLRILEKHHVPCRVTTVVTKENVLYLDRLSLMLAGFSNVRGIALDLLVSKGNATENRIEAATPDMVYSSVEALRTMLDIINSRRTIPIQLREWDMARRRTSAPCHAARGESMAVFPNGQVYPCSQTAGDSTFDCGTIKNINWNSLRMPLCGDDCPSRTHYNRGRNTLLHAAVKQALSDGVAERTTK